MLDLSAHETLLRLHPSHGDLYIRPFFLKLRSRLSYSTFAGISGREMSVVLPTTPSPESLVSMRPRASRSPTYFQNWVCARGFSAYSSPTIAYVSSATPLVVYAFFRLFRGIARRASLFGVSR